LEQHAFELAKQALVSAPIIVYPILGMPYRLYTDACDVGLAAILQQIQPMAIKDLKGTKLYGKLSKAYKANEKVPLLVVPDSKQKDILTGGAEGNSTEEFKIQDTWAESFEDTIVHVERVKAYWSRILRPEERNYSPTERECLPLREELIKFQAYLEGTKFLAVVDHAALTWS
jgi:hypothetical protein